MRRPAAVAGTVLVCATLAGLGSVATASGDDRSSTLVWGGRVSTPAAGHGRTHAPPRHAALEYAIPSGRCYTGLVIVPAVTGGVQRVTLCTDRGDFPILLEPGKTFILPFEEGWRPAREARLYGAEYGAGFEAWAITTDGPMTLVCTHY